MAEENRWVAYLKEGVAFHDPKGRKHRPNTPFEITNEDDLDYFRKNGRFMVVRPQPSSYANMRQRARSEVRERKAPPPAPEPEVVEVDEVELPEPEPAEEEAVDSALIGLDFDDSMTKKELVGVAEELGVEGLDKFRTKRALLKAMQAKKEEFMAMLADEPDDEDEDEG